jgi:hypothetical protein
MFYSYDEVKKLPIRIGESEALGLTTTWKIQITTFITMRKKLTSISILLHSFLHNIICSRQL